MRFILHLPAVLLVTLLPAAASGSQVGYFTESGRIVRVDTSVFADIPTAELVELARARHSGTALKLQGYDARIFTRLEGRVGTSRFGRGLQMFAYETAADLAWEQPGIARVDVRGVRAAAPRLPGMRRDHWTTWWSELFSGELWFSPAALGDEIELMGLPDRNALHPLARQGAHVYRYEVVDSVRMVTDERSVLVLAVAVQPREHPLPLDRPHPPVTVSRGVITDHPRANQDQIVTRRVNRRPEVYDPSLVAGTMWVDADSLDVVRLSVAFVGDHIWDDDPDAPELLTVEADLEYGLFDQTHWLPTRQTLAATFRYKYLPGAILPATAVTTFSDYEIYRTPRVITDVELPPGVSERQFDGWRCPEPWEFDDTPTADCANHSYTHARIESNGTQWELHVPPLPELEAFDFSNEFSHTVDEASERYVQERISGLAGISEALPQQWRPTPPPLIDWRQAVDAFRFNRVQGASVGGTVSRPIGVAFTDVALTGRFGLGDRRVTGAVDWRRDGPGSLVTVTAFHRLADLEPWTSGTSIGHSFKALLSGHDDADYLMASGGAVSITGRAGPWADLTLTAGVERHRSVQQTSGSFVNDVLFGSGRFQANPAVTAGDFGRFGLTKSWYPGRMYFTAGAELLAGGRGRSGRAHVTATVPFSAQDVLGSVRLKAGRIVGDTLVQFSYRAGGPETVRGYTYGIRRGQTLWSVQTDLEWEVSRWYAPLLFFDVGNVDALDQPLVGIGTGVSAGGGWMRLELAKGISPARPLRADVLFLVPFN